MRFKLKDFSTTYNLNLKEFKLLLIIIAQIGSDMIIEQYDRFSILCRANN